MSAIIDHQNKLKQISELKVNFTERITSPDIKVPPPGINSRIFLELMEHSVGKTNYAGLYGITLVSGDGYYVKDADGNCYIDFLAGASANILGYNSGLERVYAKQAQKIQHICLAYSVSIPAILLAEYLISITPGDFKKKVIFGMSGSDACGGAIEAMRKFTRRYKVISFKCDWHGSSGLSQPASGFDSLNRGIYEPEKNYFIHLDYPETEEDAESVLDAVEALFRYEDVGGVLFEAIQGDAGVIIPPEGFIKKMAGIVHAHGGLVMVDEVQSGMGRTGKWWAIEHEDTVPDLLMIGKGFSAGYAPISAVVGRAEVLDSLSSGQELFTYEAHAPSTAVALDVLKQISDNHMMKHVNSIGNLILHELENLKERYPTVIRDIRGRGLMIGMEIDTYQYNRDLPAGAIFATRGVEKGIYFGLFGCTPDPVGKHSEGYNRKQNVVRIEPPFIIDENAVNHMVKVAEEIAKEMENGTIPNCTIENVKKYTIGI